MKHIYQIEKMEEYLPKEFYFGRSGKVQSFLDSMSSVLFPQKYSDDYKNKLRPIELKYINEIRNMTLLQMKEEYFQCLLKRYSRYIIEKLITDNYEKKERDMIYYLEFSYSGKYNSLSVEFHGYGNQGNYKKIEVTIDKNDIVILKDENNQYRRLNTKQISKFNKYCYEIIELINKLSPKDEGYQCFYCNMSTYFSDNGYIELDF